MSKAESRSLLVAPATALQVMACFSILTFIVQGIYFASILVMLVTGRFFFWQELVVPSAMLVLVIFGIGVQIAVIILAGKMKRSTSYYAAMACAILTLIPCCSPIIFYLNYLALGILCLIFLLNEQVKKGFRS